MAEFIWRLWVKGDKQYIITTSYLFLAKNMAPQTQSNITGVLLSLAGFALYSAHDVIVKYLGTYYTPFQILFFSVLFSFPLVNLFIIRNPRTGSLWPHHPVQMGLRILATSASGFCAFYALVFCPCRKPMPYYS